MNMNFSLLSVTQVSNLPTVVPTFINEQGKALLLHS